MPKLSRDRILTRSQTALNKRATSRTARTGPKSKIGKTSFTPLRKRIEPAHAISKLEHFGLNYAPAYTNGRGGREVTAVLGPGLASLAKTGWTNVKGQPLTKLDKARKHYLGLGLVAGHLLNARFGGAGDDSKNLTILSASGNHNHQAFDDPVALAVEQLYELYDLLRRAGVRVSQLTYGIEVNISVSDATWGSQAPDKFICQYLTCQARLPNKKTILKHVSGIQLMAAKDIIHDMEILLENANGSRSGKRKVINTKH